MFCCRDVIRSGRGFVRVVLVLVVLADIAFAQEQPKELWRFGQGTTSYPASAALGADGSIYVGCSDGKLYALSPAGLAKWSFRTGSDIKSSPAVAEDGSICFGSRDRHFYALLPSGKKK